MFAVLEARQDLDTEDKALVMQLSPLYLDRIHKATEQGIERVVMRLLHVRVGSIAPQVEARVRDLKVDRLEALSEGLLSFDSEADLVRWLEEEV